MTDDVHTHIEALVAEEHRLWEHEASGNGSDERPAPARRDQGRARPLLGSPAPAPLGGRVRAAIPTTSGCAARAPSRATCSNRGPGAIAFTSSTQTLRIVYNVVRWRRPTRSSRPLLRMAAAGAAPRAAAQLRDRAGDPAGHARAARRVRRPGPHDREGRGARGCRQDDDLPPLARQGRAGAGGRARHGRAGREAARAR